MKTITNVYLRQDPRHPTARYVFDAATGRQVATYEIVGREEIIIKAYYDRQGRCRLSGQHFADFLALAKVRGWLVVNEPKES